MVMTILAQSRVSPIGGSFHADKSKIPAPVGRHCGGSTCRDTRSLCQGTIERLKKDIATKGIKFFDEIDQSKLAADAGIKLNPSTLLVFGNPPLGTQFMRRTRTRGSTGRCGSW
jgi:hypothetical protein